MKKTILFLAVLLTSSFLSAQSDEVLMTIDGEPIMVSDFLYIYQKNNQEQAVEKKSISEYLDLFVNFRLKVHEAQQQGLDTLPTFISELKGYRAQATPKYLRDNEAVDSLIRMSYDRVARDRRAAHIAVECHYDEPDSVQEAALQKINLLRERVTVGVPKKVGKGKKAKTVYEKEDFYEVAVAESSDPNVQENKGELGWITPFRYVYEFEDAVYNTPIGEVTPVFRSAYGYHIALVEEERPHQEIKASHIMKMVPRGNDSIEALKKEQIDSLYNVVMAGEDSFAAIATANSEDRGSAMKGGDLGWFARGVMVPQFEQAAFAMKDSGEVSKPIRSNFGWHIIQLNGKRDMQPFEQMKEQIERNVQRDARMKEADKSFIKKTRKEYNLSDDMTDEEVRTYADEHLEEKYDSLRLLVKEYHDGILLFDVSLKEVWDRASKDTVGLTNYFKTNKKKYTWNAPRYKGYVVFCKDKASMKAAKSIIKNAPKDSVDSYIKHRVNMDSLSFVIYNRGLWEKGMNKAVDQYGFKDKKAAYEPQKDYPYVFVVGKKIKAPQEYTDERSKVTTDYQDYLEQAWLQILKEKYPVVFNEDALDKLLQEVESVKKEE